MEFKDDLRQHFKIDMSMEQENLLNHYYEKLIEFNKHTNLTTITEYNDVYYKHFYDSLTLSPYLSDDELSLCDMGSGAGFPSIPLKIFFPNLKVTIIDSSNKRIKFLTELTNELNLKDVTIVHSRIEEYGNDNQEKFDIVTARALGNLTLITEMAIPMLKVNGRFIAMKGSKGFEELNDAKNAIKLTGGKTVIKSQITLPYEYGERIIIVIEKERHVKGYPRQYQQMIKKPL